jgi:leader peptidase (prepilin peptidase)/N-methyltransferase
LSAPSTQAEAPLWPRPAIFLGGSAAVALISFAFLPWPVATASTALGALMIAGADVDARTFLLPDTVTGGALAGGVLAAAVLAPADPWITLGDALVRAAGTVAALLLLRFCYAWLRRREGLGLGDVKLGAAIGAWLPLDAIPMCFALAAGGALLLVLMARLRGRPMDGQTRLPFGAFLCPALWLLFYVGQVGG